MARKIEGTVAGGFICDSDDCSFNAIWAVIVCTPYQIDAETIRTGQGKAPILTFTDVHVCHHHWSVVNRELTTDHMREAIKRIADERRGKPDFDHARIISYARERIGYKLEYTDVAKNILPEKFPLSELQKTYETILGKTFDKRNFRKKILSLGILRETGVTDKSASKRPAMLYEFVSKGKGLEIVEMA